MYRSVALFLVFAAASAAVAGDERPEAITKPSEVSLFDGKLKVQVKDDGSTTRFDVTYMGSGGSHGIGTKVESAKAAGWFVVPESANRVWLYKGGEVLMLIEITDNPPGEVPGTKGSTVALYPGQENTAAALAKAPKAVLDRLPVSFKSTGKGK